MIFVAGYPSDIGGANTELWHTVKLWRRFGLDVTLLPTWEAPLEWKHRLDAIGCRTVALSPPGTGGAFLDGVPGLAGSIVVSMCNTRFLAVAEQFRARGCRIVWLGCMNWLFTAEKLHYKRFGPFDRHVFQSRYQHDQLVPQLRRFGFRDEQSFIIPGAFDPEEFPLRPLRHEPDTIFEVGRIGRAEVDKFRRDFWRLLSKVPHSLRVRVLGWNEECLDFIGDPPHWAECLSPGAVPVRDFLAGCHCLVALNGQSVENWPRVGLEAMAAGVPIVADNRGGWREMIEDGHSGFLCDTLDEAAFRIANLAYDEQLRMGVVIAGRNRVESLSAPEPIWLRWYKLLAGLGYEPGGSTAPNSAFAGTA
jgi:glycosyltransferase involved in cell wall biosynthesis